MRLCWNLLLAASVVFAVISDVASKKEDEKKPPKLGKKCVFNKGKFKKGTTVTTYEKACVEIKCVEQEDTGKAIMELHSIKGCECGGRRRRRSIIDVEGPNSFVPLAPVRRNLNSTRIAMRTLQRTARVGPSGRLVAVSNNNPMARVKRPSQKKKPKCKFNDKKYKFKETVIDAPKQCVKLECKKKGKKGFLKFAYDSSCQCAEDDFHWCYHDDCGPEFWPDHYPDCGASRQSPIDIVTADVVTDASLTDFTFTNYETELAQDILNNGHSARVASYPDDAADMPTIRGGGLDGEYEFLQYHFHWGSVSRQGSEHTINGVEYPLELHLVHWKKSYGTVGDAIVEGDGLAVLGVLFETGEGVADNPAFADVVAALGEIIETGAEYDLPAKQALAPLLPADTSKFFRYLGSLTTPTCNEAVVWTAFQETVQISQSQLAAFRELLDDKGSPIVDNYRPPQPLNGRTVTQKV